jgi:hypothetical protein
MKLAGTCWHLAVLFVAFLGTRVRTMARAA